MFVEETVIQRIEQTKTESPIVVIEGIRRFVDIGTLLKEPNFRLIYIEVDSEVAYERMKNRNENVSDAEITWEKFLELGNAEAEQQIRLLKHHAHLVIDNSGEHAKLETVLRAEVAKWLIS